MPSASVQATSSMHSCDLVTLAHAAAESVHVPAMVTCCAFAEDRGMLHPEQRASATAREAGQVAAAGCLAHLSTNRTCEVGMEHATGSVYESVIFALEEATPP